MALESEDYSTCKRALREVGVDAGVIDELTGETRLLELRMKPPQAARFLMGVIPLADYVRGNTTPFFGQDFEYAKLSEQGVQRIRAAAEKSGRRERGEELITIGTEKNVGVLYTDLTFQDVFDICSYEAQRRAAAA